MTARIYVAEQPNDPALLNWLEGRKVIAFDTETTGLGRTDTVRLVQVGTADEAWVIPAHHVTESLLRRIAARMLLIHNAPFDVRLVRQTWGFDIPTDRVIDTKLMAAVAFPGENTGLKPTAERLGLDEFPRLDKALQELMRKNKWDWATIPIDHELYLGYAAMDPVLTARLYEAIRLDPDEQRAYDREIRAAWCGEAICDRGVAVDLDYLYNLQVRWNQELEDLSKSFGSLNPNSARQVAEALELPDDAFDYTPTGQRSVTRNFLQSLDIPLAQSVLRYRRLRKWLSAYVEPLLESGGIVHPDLNTFGARTGRMSMRHPPLQQLPRDNEVRGAIVPFCHSLYSIDYDSMELRLLASYTRDPQLVEAFRLGQDVHSMVAEAVFGSTEYRQLAKNVHYGLLYGAGRQKLAETAGTDVQTIDRFLESYRVQFPAVARWLKWCQSSYHTLRTVGGRRLPDLKDKEYVAVNYLIQGGCADLFKDRLIQLEEKALLPNVRLLIHDEVVVEAETDEEAQDIAQVLQVDETVVPLTISLHGPWDRWRKE